MNPSLDTWAVDIDAIFAERDENVCRKDFTPSEAVAIGKKIEELERPKAKERQKAHGKTAPGKPNSTSGKIPEVNGETGRTADKAAQAVDMDRKTYTKAKEVIEAAQADPDTFGDLPERMDEEGKVEPAHREYVKRTQEKNGTAPKPPRFPCSDRIERWLKMVFGEIELINQDFGGIEPMVKRRKEWDQRTVREYIDPMLESLEQTIAAIRKAIQYVRRD